MSGIFAPDDFRNVAIGEVPVKAADGTFVGVDPTEGTGDMLKAVYDTDNSGVVDDAEKLGGELPAHYVNTTEAQSIAGVKTLEDNTIVNSIQYATNPALPTLVAGVSFWDDESGTRKTVMKNTEVMLNDGQEIFVPFAKNGESVTITNGTLVYVFGATGNNPIMKIASNDVVATACCTLAMATHNVSPNEHGYYTTQGLVNDINTNAFEPGDQLYLGLNGQPTKVIPANNVKVDVGYCIRKSATVGSIFVFIDKNFHNEIYAPSDLLIKCIAQKTLVLEQPVYDDFLPSITTPAVGVAAPDTINLTIEGVTISGPGFDGVNTEERLSVKTEMYHSYKEGTTICVHIHFKPTTNDAGTVTWYFDWYYSPVNAAPIAGGTISSTTNIPANSLGHHFLVDIGDISIAELGIGDFIIGNLRRTPSTDTYPADVMLMQVANHVQIDTMGSRQEYIK